MSNLERTMNRASSKVATLAAACVIFCVIVGYHYHPAAAQQAAIVLHENTYLGSFTGVELGVGFNSVTAAVAGKCITQPPAPQCDDSQKKTQYRMQFVTNTSTLKAAMGIGASASFTTGIWGAEASAQFASAKSILSDSAYLYLDVEVKLGEERIDAPLGPASLQKLTSDPEGFIAACGDAYVASITRGGHYRAIYEFRHVSETSKRELGFSLSASGLNWHTDTTFAQALHRSVANYETNLYVSKAGGRFDGSAMSVAELIKQAREFETQVTCASSRPTIGAMTKLYYTAKNFPAGQRVLDLSPQVRELERMAPNFDAATVLANDISERLNNPGRLNDAACDGDKKMLLAKQNELKQYLTAAGKKAAACQTVSRKGPSPDCMAPVPLPGPLELPRLADANKCGPMCTELSGSKFESDQYGYCMRCTWEPRGPRDLLNQNAGFLDSECRFMRRGSRVLARARGWVNPNWTQAQGTTWIEVGLSAQSGSRRFSHGAGYPEDWVSYPNAKAHKPFTFETYAWVAKDARLAAVTVGLYQQMCQGSSPCTYHTVEFDVCDVGNPKGCAW